MTAEPQHLLASLGSAELPSSISVELDTPFSTAASALPNNVTLHVLGGMGSARALGKTHPLNIDRTEYLDLTEQYANGARQADIVLVSLARAADGSLHLGASHGPAVHAARRARHVIAEINTQAPVVTGAPWPDDIAITHQVDCSYPIASIDGVTAASETEQRIAEHLAELIPNGACLQVGIGSLPSAVLSLLASHRHLGIHSGILGDALNELIRQQAVDNSMKPAGMQRCVVGCVYGTADLYNSVEQNEQVLLAGPDQTHSLAVLQQLSHFTAINSAIEVDLLGRVNSESILARDGSRLYVGGVGGLPACVRGAHASPGGQSIIALPSRTKPGIDGRARIVKSLNAEITLDETLADIVVTEHGVARLRGASKQSRRAQLIAIADPDDREQLEFTQ